MAFEGGIKVRILGDDSDLQRTLRDSTVQIAKYSAAAAAAGAAITTAFVQRGLAAADAQAKLAGQLDTTSASMATLSRAAGLSGVSFEKITSGTRQLTVRLSQAASGAGPAAEMLERLGLSAEYLSSIPLDQRIDAINQAILENIPVTERAAAGAALFGEEAGLAFRQISGDTLRQAAKEAELFGTALSEIDARKIEIANDSISSLSLAFQGAQMQLASELAPVVQLIGDEFVDAAEKFGGIPNAIEIGVDESVRKMIAFAATVRPVILSIKEQLDNVWAGYSALPAWAQEVGIVGAMMGGKKGFAVLAALSAAAKETQATGAWFAALTEGDISFYEWLTTGADEAREKLKEMGYDLDQMATDRSGPSVFQSLFGGSQDETDEWEQRMLDAYERIRQKTTEQAAESLDLGGEGEDGEQALLGPITLSDEFFDEQLERLREQNAQRLALEGEFTQQQLAEIERREQDIADLEAKRRKERVQGASDMFANLSTLMNTGSKKLFNIGKAAALANAVVTGYEAAVEAYKGGLKVSGGIPAVGAAFAAASLAATGAQISAIRSQSFGGGGGASGSPTQAINAASAPVGGAGINSNASQQVQGPTTVINLSGDTFGRRQVRDLLEQLNEEGRNGGRLVIA